MVLLGNCSCILLWLWALWLALNCAVGKRGERVVRKGERRGREIGVTKVVGKGRGGVTGCGGEDEDGWVVS